MWKKKIQVFLGICIFVFILLCTSYPVNREIETSILKDGDIELIIEDILSKPYGDIDFVSFYYKEDDYHIECDNIKYQREDSKKSTIILLKDINWNITDEYFVYINFRERLYTTKITKEDMGKSITIDYDKNKYGKLQVSIPFAKENYRIDDILVHCRTEDTNLDNIYTGSFDNNIDLPFGTYDIQVNACDSENVYILYKENVTMGKGSNFLEFNRNDVAKLKIKFDYGKYKDAKPVLISSYQKEGIFSTITSLSSSAVRDMPDFRSLYVLKGKQDIYVHIRNQGWNYTFDKYLEVKEDTELSFDLNLKAKIETEKTKFRPGVKLNREIRPMFVFHDGFGNVLTNINEPLNEVIEGIVEFKQGDKIKIEKFYTLKDIKNITAPKEPGNYEMTLKLTGGPIEIMPAKKDINIGWGQ